ncbi:MAG: T9SS type A sorting domain-containing protein [Bacteroidales bacterium]|nr:T9SS type A sorting domain-containing protein [Bacteroidales bacterium]MBP5327267.1 T9SS type A sorting domain-containing protein [Bacteroidales bacterium]MCR5193540.1 T9SS type A sorting domain-containing protein [Bacteroidales bacterium]
MECEGGCTKSIEVSGLAQGAYFVRVSGDSLNMVKKLIVK